VRRTHCPNTLFCHNHVFILCVTVRDLAFQELNFTGFRKILKKHDKNLETESGAQWRKNYVETAPFHKDRFISEYILKTEVRLAYLCLKLPSSLISYVTWPHSFSLLTISFCWLWWHRCRSRQIFGGAKDFYPNFPKFLPEKFLCDFAYRFSPTKIMKTFFWSDLQKGTSCVFLQAVSIIF